MKRKIALFLIILSILLLTGTQNAKASDGTIELRSLTSESYHCFAASLRMQNLNYTIIVSCRDLVYPADDSVFAYIMWANPIPTDTNKSTAPVKLGALGFGKAQFVTNRSFSQLFVTTEANANTNKPSNDIVMRGYVEPISFLTKPTTPTPTPLPSESGITPTPTPGTSLRDKIVLGLKRAGIAAGLAVVTIGGLVYIITRPRRG